METVELPDPGPGQVLLQILASGICHSQLHQIHGTLGGNFPMLLGHEATADVLEVGAGVGALTPGDRVLVTWLERDAPPDPAPLPDIDAVRWGASELKGNRGSIYTWAEHCVVAEDFCVRVPRDTAPDVTSVIGCAVMTGAGAAINSADVQAGQSAAVFGVGGVGLSTIAGLAVRGADPIIAVDLADEKLDFAKRFGATVGINAATTDPVAAIQDLTNGGADFTFDAIGLPETVTQIIDAVRPGRWGAHRGGTAVIIGGGSGEALISTRALLQGERHLIGSLGGSCRPARDFPEFLRWYGEGQLDLDAFITERYRLDDVNDAVARLEQGAVLGRSIFDFT